jgi:hypothetical protein
MQPRPLLLTIRARRLAVLLLYALIVALASCAATPAQSGRRSKSQQPQPPPAPPAESESHSGPTDTKPAPPTMHIIVTKSVPSANVALWTSMAYRSFVDRLKDSPGLDVVEGKEMNRKQAIELAKSKEGEETYVAWLQMEVDVETGDTERTSIASINPGCLFINYYLYSPGTGKVKAQGKVYQDGYQSVCTGVPSRPSPFPTSLPQSRRMPVDYTLRKAGREAANRVLDALNRVAPLRYQHPACVGCK